MRTLEQHLHAKGPKRILSLDGGGVRGLITIGILGELESQLRARFASRLTEQGRSPETFRLCDYFDLIGGTSTGGIIAAMLALGFSAAEIETVYLEMCPRIFRAKRKSLLSRILNPYDLFQPSFDAGEFKDAVDDIMRMLLKRENRVGHAEPLLGTDLFRTGVALVMKRIDTGSVWVLTNNKRMKYWDPDDTHWQHKFESPAHKFFPGRDYPLGLLARATASAPFLLEAAELAITPIEIGVFLDGGVTPFNNPALELFLMTTLKSYDQNGSPSGYSPFGFDWEARESELLLYSIGTGSWRVKMSAEDYRVKHNWDKARVALLSMIDDGMKSSLIWLQALSEPYEPARVDGNLGGMRNLRILPDKLLTFQRLNIDLEVDALSAYLQESVTETLLNSVRQLDNADHANLTRLVTLGRAAGRRLVSPSHLPTAFDII